MFASAFDRSDRLSLRCLLNEPRFRTYLLLLTLKKQSSKQRYQEDSLCRNTSMPLGTEGASRNVAHLIQHSSGGRMNAVLEVVIANQRPTVHIRASEGT